MDNDFGFSILHEDELKASEKKLTKKLKEQQNNTYLKLNELRDMIMPLLENLKANPEKSYINWPNREEKINEFIDKINGFIEKNK